MNADSGGSAGEIVVKVDIPRDSNHSEAQKRGNERTENLWA